MSLTQPPTVAARSVAPVKAIRLVYGIVLHELATRGRIIWLALVALTSTFAGLAIRSADAADIDDGVTLIEVLGLAAVVPFVTLVFAGASIGDMRDDKTLVYLWLRPMDRWPIVVGAALAALTLAAPITLIPLMAGAVLTGVGGGIVAGTAAAGTVGIVAYVCIFTFLGVWLRGWIWWGLGYILIWEGFIAQASLSVARFSIRRYTRSILIELTDTTKSPDFSLTMSVVVPLLAAVAAIVIASWRLGSQDID